MKNLLLKAQRVLIQIFNTIILKLLLPSPKILTVEESILSVINTKKSVCRFGDGELWCLLGGGIRYQQPDPNLANRLKQILSSRDERIEVCLPDVFTSKRLNLRTLENQKFWKNHLIENRLNWYRFLNWKRVYLNTAISRFYIPFLDKEKSKTNCSLLKELWEGKDLLIVEGEKSRLGVGNDLFSNSKSISRILCPPENAFFKYDKILEAVKEFEKNVLVLIALGPTATVLAYDLGTYGYWSIDIGHVDLEYHWMNIGAEKQVKVEGKYVNEVSNGNDVKENLEKSSVYWKQIKNIIT